MNPFDLRGPAFLLFYVLFAAAVLAVAAIVRRALESGPVPRFHDVDPYLIAHLRAGSYEALRVATLSLLDRGLLKADGDQLQAEKRASTRVRRPLERAILAEFEEPARATSMFRRDAPLAADKALRDELKKQRLLPNISQIVVRLAIRLGALAVLWWVGYHKMVLAHSRGHYNTNILLALMLAAPFVVHYVLRTRRTTIGQRLLQDLQTLFSKLRDRADQLQPGGATNELALLAGIFGMSALSGPAFTQAQALFPAAIKSSNSSASGSSSCGTSCGGGGSSCGGGGSSCGGGCGGCGGGGCGG